MTKSKMLAMVSIAAVLFIAGMAQATTTTIGPLTFATSSDYDNAASQTLGVFRDFLNGTSINRGLDLGGTGHTALNFTGSGSAPSGGINLSTRLTLYDTTPTNSSPQNLWAGSITLSADILISTANNDKSVGLVTLFNEGASERGLSLFVHDAGNTDSQKLALVFQTGVSSTNLVSVAFSGGPIAEDKWYRLTMAVTISGDSLGVTGTVYPHTTATDPGSGLGSQIGTTLSYTGSVTGLGLDNPGEVGIGAMGAAGSVIDSSVTNFKIVGVVPEPATVALLGLGGLALLKKRRA